MTLTLFPHEERRVLRSHGHGVGEEGWGVG